MSRRRTICYQCNTDRTTTSQSCTNLMSIQCQSSANLMWIHRLSDFNPSPIRGRSIKLAIPTNWASPIHWQSSVNPPQIHFQFVNPSPIPQFNDLNQWPVCQSTNTRPIWKFQCQPSVNSPCHRFKAYTRPNQCQTSRIRTPPHLCSMLNAQNCIDMDWHALTQFKPINGQSEATSVSNRGTSVL